MNFFIPKLGQGGLAGWIDLGLVNWLKLQELM